MKRIISVILILTLTISLVGCNTDNLAEYKKASEKTEQIKKGQMTGEFSVLMNFNTDGMTDQEIKELNYFKDMNGNFSSVFDYDKKLGIYRNYLNFGGLGFDFDLYINGEEVFMKLPVLGKYIRLNELQTSTNINPDKYEEIQFISKESIKAIYDKWIGLMKKDDVFKGKDIILTTPDGEVKTTEYTINLNDERLKGLLIDILDIVSKDNNTIKFYNDFIYTNSIEIEKDLETADISFDRLISDLKDLIRELKNINLNYTALVDIDGFIVNEIIEFSMETNNPESKELSDVSFTLNLKNWDINKKQNFSFPELTEDNTIKIDKDENMPEMFMDIMKINKD